MVHKSNNKAIYYHSHTASSNKYFIICILFITAAFKYKKKNVVFDLFTLALSAINVEYRLHLDIPIKDHTWNTINILLLSWCSVINNVKLPINSWNFLSKQKRKRQAYTSANSCHKIKLSVTACINIVLSASPWISRSYNINITCTHVRAFQDLEDV